MRVKDDVGSELIAGFVNLGRNAGVIVGPSVADVSRVIIADQSSIDSPPQCILAAVRRHVGKEWDLIGDAMDFIVKPFDPERLRSLFERYLNDG